MNKLFPELQLIGLTGGIASGKSTIAEYLMKKKKIPVIDMDVIAKNVREQPDVAKHILAEFGTKDDGELREIVFNDLEKKQQLERIIHPLAIQATTEQIAQLHASGARKVVINAPLLIEAGMDITCDRVWVIDITPQEQLKRLKKRSPYLSDAQARAIINSQMSRNERNAHATDLIDGQTTEKLVQLQVDALLVQ